MCCAARMVTLIQIMIIIDLKIGCNGMTLTTTITKNIVFFHINARIPEQQHYNYNIIISVCGLANEWA